MEAIVAAVEFVWGVPLMALMVGVGLYLTMKVHFFQLTHARYICRNTLGYVGKESAKSSEEGNISPVQAISVVLAGTVGSGNIAGVASAIAVGGPGAVFWMWCIAFVGMITKMAEVALAVRFRKVGENGNFYGGPMHYIRDGLGEKWQWLAGTYAVALLILVVTDATFVQPNTLATTAQNVFGIPLLVSGVVTILVSMAIILGGIRRIGEVCEKFIPAMILLFLVGALGVIVMNFKNIPAAFAMIFKYAFAPAPAMGGFLGATVMGAMSRGASRGIFSNEAGMGTATTVHATSRTDHPIRQGMWGIIEVFIDTVLICTLVALCILVSGVWNNGETGANLTFAAFRTTWGDWGLYILGIAVILFTYSSYLGFYIEYRTTINYLFGEKIEKYLTFFYFIPPLISVILPIEAVWTMADMATGFLVIPNMIALVLLSGVFISLFKEFLNQNPSNKS